VTTCILVERYQKILEACFSTMFRDITGFPTVLIRYVLNNKKLFLIFTGERISNTINISVCIRETN